jgi:hypothetical protein
MAHVVHSLAPWVERFEQAAECDLIGDEADQCDFEVVAKMSLQTMMRGDAKARANANRRSPSRPSASRPLGGAKGLHVDDGGGLM